MKSVHPVIAARRRLIKAFSSKHLGGPGNSNRSRASGVRAANTVAFVEEEPGQYFPAVKPYRRGESR